MLASVSRSSALGVLISQGLIPVELRELTDTAGAGKRSAVREALHLSRWRQWPSGRGLSSRELLALTQSLAALLNAGLTIDRVLQISATLTPRSRARTLIERLLTSVRSGKTFAESLEASGQRFPPYYISMINAGEAGGSLPESAARLADLMRRQEDIRERVRSALVYPALLAAVILFTLVVLLVFVLPRFEALFAEADAPLPLATQVVLDIGQFIGGFWWALLLGGTGLWMALHLWLRSPAGGLRFDRWLLRSRATLGLPAAIGTAMLLRTLSTLCRNGLTLPAALRIARGTLANRCLLDSLTDVTREVQAGGSFSLALSGAGIFPTVAVQLARVGEETGKLDDMLLSAAAVLEDESQLRIERLITLFVPLLTIAMGAIVAGLIGSVLIGLLSINDLAG